MNFPTIIDAFGTASFQIITSAEFAVDTFFVLSGCLAAYMLLKATHKALRQQQPRGVEDSASSAGRDGLGAMRSGGVAGVAPSSSAAAVIHFSTAGGGGGRRGGKGVSVGEHEAPLLSNHDHSSDAVSGDVDPSPLSVLPPLYAYYVVHRYLRLLPCLAVTIGLILYVAPLLGSGPFWDISWVALRSQCQSNGWTNLLFVNNFLPHPWEHNLDEQCAAWTW